MFKGLKNNIMLKIKRIQQNIKLMKYDRVRCDISKLDIHRSNYSRHLIGSIEKHMTKTGGCS